MRVFVASLLLIAAAAGAEASDVPRAWKITKDHWSTDDERRFGQFVVIATGGASRGWGEAL